MKKIISVITAAVVSVSAAAALTTGASADWVKFKDGSYGYKNDRTEKYYTGLKRIDGGLYFFDKNGKIVTGWKTIGDDRYYFNGGNRGRAITSWAKIGENTYHFENDGSMDTGWEDIGGRTYYFGTDGVMRTGVIKLGSRTYDLGEDGVLKNIPKKEKTAVSADVYDPMYGLSAGMTYRETLDTLGLEKGDYTYYDDTLTVESGEDILQYEFDDGRLEKAIITTPYTDEKAEGYKSFFDGWKVEFMRDEADRFVAEYEIRRSDSEGELFYDYDVIICEVSYDIDD